MKHLYLIFVFIAILLIQGIPASAAYVDGVYYNLYSSTATVTKSRAPYKYKGNIVIPTSIMYEGKSYKVTGIENFAFSDCDDLISVTIAEGMTSVGNWAFEKCNSLTSLILPNSITSIGEEAFYDCSALTSINIPSGLTKIPRCTFAGCSSLTSLVIPDGVTSIGPGAFSQCSGLTSLTIGINVKDIDVNAFGYCSSLTNITLPNSVVYIREKAFNECSSLTSISIGSGVTSIGNEIFYGCNNLVDIHVDSGNPVFDSRDNCNAIVDTKSNTLCFGCKASSFPNSVTKIGSYAFHHCDGLTSICIDNNITSIDEFAFASCNNLSSVTIGNSITRIGECAFSGCELLSRVSFGDNVTDIGSSAFEYCERLYSVTLPNNLTFVGSKAFPDRCMLYVSRDHISLFALLANTEWYKVYDINTKESLPIKKITPTSILFHKIGGNVEDVSIYVDGIQLNKETMELTGMEPNEKVKIKMNVSYKDNSGNICSLNGFEKVITRNLLILTTQQPKVTKLGEAIVCATTNMDDKETNVGFEWRKIDAPDVVPSRTGESIIYNGAMEGKIKNLDASTYWKVRPFYKSGSNTMYYGEWIGFDPSDFSYFEPTVHTYNSATISENNVILTGMAIEGSDPILEQGFEYWNTASEESLGSRAPANSQQVTAEGQRMQAVLTNLTEGSSYSYRAYVKTEKGFFYGEECSFVSPSNGNDQSTVSFVEVQYSASSDVYDFRGVKVRSNATTLNGLPRGLYIFNGRKVIVR